jgi:protein-S-isoprenylcysteine O-methyltransferase Ste14
MLKDPFGWFPNPLFGTILGYTFLLGILIDSLLPRYFISPQKPAPVFTGDRASFLSINVAELLAILSGLTLRYFKIGVTGTAGQFAGLMIMIAGFLFRDWALWWLGRFFSRFVQIKSGHQLITNGPYRFLRHPAYTGMLMIFFGFLLGIGTWLGALLGLILIGIAVLYRINVEEKVLAENFGNEYHDYMKRTWRIFPGF